MSDAFQDRENTFEKQFANDETLRFRATARRNKALALWVAEMKGVSGEAAGKFAEALHRGADRQERRRRRGRPQGPNSPAAMSTSPTTGCARRWARRWPWRWPR